MDDAELITLEPATGPALKDDAVFVVTSAFGEHAVGDEVTADEASTAPHHAVVRRAPAAPAHD